MSMFIPYSSYVGQVVSKLAFGADNPGSIPGGGAEKGKLFPCCFPVLRRALQAVQAVGPVGQEP